MKSNLKVIPPLALISIMIVLLVPVVTVKAEDTFLWGANVLSTGDPISSPVLEAGRQYRIVAREIFWYDAPNNLGADAQYYTTDPSHIWQWGNHFPAPDGHSFLQINEMDVNWGPFSNGDTGHTYAIYYTGTGAPITFRIVDWIDGDYCNNRCHLPVEIYESIRFYGCTPGFWKNHPSAWPNGYNPDAWLNSVFGSCAPHVTLMESLRLHGGRKLDGAKNILARTAVAALLNAETFGSSYKYTSTQVIEMVEYQFCNGDRGSILSLAEDLDFLNNMGCPPCWP